jgi:hypothetical protein
MKPPLSGIWLNHRCTGLFILSVLVVLSASCNRGTQTGTGNNPLNDPFSSGGGKSSIVGTWNGSISCEPGGSTSARYKVSENGNPIYEYQTKSGSREAELTSNGQVVRFVPPGGGVANVQVEALSVSADRIIYTLNISEERTSMDTLDQNRAVVTSEARMTSAGLEVEMAVRAQGVASQPGMVVPGEEQSATCRGTLQKQ